MSTTSSSPRRIDLSARQHFLIFAVTAPTSIVVLGQVWPPALWLLAVVGPVVLLGLRDCYQRKHSLLRVYPVIGHGRFLAERFRPEIQQYFVESNTNGAPFSRATREIIYSRAKGEQDKLPFGTQMDVYQPGYEFLAHSMYPKHAAPGADRIIIGGPECSQPYLASILNVSAMSFGALSDAAIRALSTGAARGGFAHNTGEGGISPHHLAGGADLIWQIGTGYFGCRSADGRFDPDKFAEQAALEAVKAIEIKLSQGAKPAHGGILPAAKLTPEIARIRGVELGRDVISPAAHSAFDSPAGLLHFVARLRQLSGGKPIGFKLCIGDKSEFLEVVAAMRSTGISPDFITVDGAEGGTGAAPPELSDSVGLPLREGLHFVHRALVDADLRQGIRLIAAGKVATGFDMARCFALGADLCNSARAMMMAIGCIQARRCHTNECPVGVATQDKRRSNGLVVADKATRVAQYHRETVANFLELVGSAGCTSPGELDLGHVHRRVDHTSVASYEEIYGTVNRPPQRRTGAVPEPSAGTRVELRAAHPG